MHDRTLLLVEDDEALRTLVARHLRARGWVVAEAGSAEEVPPILAANPRPSLILLDLNLPGDTGWDLLREGPLAGPDAPPVVIVTATRSPAGSLSVPASVSVVGEAELRSRHALRLGDVVADVPGLYVRGAAMGAGFPGSGASVLSLRGIPRTPRTLVLVDGQPVNNALSGGINVAGIPIDALGRRALVPRFLPPASLPVVDAAPKLPAPIVVVEPQPPAAA